MHAADTGHVIQSDESRPSHKAKRSEAPSGHEGVAQIQSAASKKPKKETKKKEVVEEESEPSGDQVSIAPFGKEDTSRELTVHAARTQDTLVDALENAEVAEIKRSVFRALTRLRAAEIKEFDTIARLETQAIDEYNDNHHYRAENPLNYIHSSEEKVTEDKYTSFHE